MTIFEAGEMNRALLHVNRALLCVNRFFLCVNGALLCVRSEPTFKSDYV